MAIINTNIIVLRDSGLELAQSVIIGHHFSGVAKIGVAKITMQTNFYADVEKWVEGVSNYLSVKGYDEKGFEFDYPSDSVENVFYFFDLKLKEYLLKMFPEWEETKLIITTAPVEV